MWKKVTEELPELYEEVIISGKITFAIGYLCKSLVKDNEFIYTWCGKDFGPLAFNEIRCWAPIPKLTTEDLY